MSGSRRPKRKRKRGPRFSDVAPQRHELTAKQEQFCALIVSGESQRVAYVKAFDPKTATKKTIDEMASRMRKHPAVLARIAEMRKPVVEEAQLSHARHLADLRKLRNMAAKAGQFGPAVTAEKARGESSGLYEKKVNLKGKMTLEQLVAGVGAEDLDGDEEDDA